VTQTQEPYELAEQAAARLRELTGVERHDVAMVLGSGWLPAADALGEPLAVV
jgi:purine-nucleoside phosphorylase